MILALMLFVGAEFAFLLVSAHRDKKRGDVWATVDRNLKAIFFNLALCITALICLEIYKTFR